MGRDHLLDYITFVVPQRWVCGPSGHFLMNNVIVFFVMGSKSTGKQLVILIM